MRTTLAKTKDSSVLGFAQIELNVSRSPWVKLVFLSLTQPSGTRGTVSFAYTSLSDFDLAQSTCFYHSKNTSAVFARQLDTVLWVGRGTCQGPEEFGPSFHTYPQHSHLQKAGFLAQPTDHQEFGT